MHNILFGGSMTTFTTEDRIMAQVISPIQDPAHMKIVNKLQIVVRLKTNYGSQVIYPTCDKAKLFAKLLNQETLTPLNIRVIKELGYEVVVKPSEPSRL